MEIISKYFPDLTEEQLHKLDLFMGLLREWNSKINLVSRKDVEDLELHHVLHCMAISKWTTFAPGTHILDIGTGGGLPGIPLAILHPECAIHMIDARQKKIAVVSDLIDKIGLKNARATHERAEDVKDTCDFTVSRAVTSLEGIFAWSVPRLRREGFNALPNGCIVLKGGDLKEEVRAMQSQTYVETTSIGRYFSEPYFREKYIVYMQG